MSWSSFQKLHDILFDIMLNLEFNLEKLNLPRLRSVNPERFLNVYLIYNFAFLFFFLGPHLWHMEVPRLGAHTTATVTAMWDPSRISHLYHSLWQLRILNLLSKARDRTCVLIDTTQICFRWATTRTPTILYF